MRAGNISKIFKIFMVLVILIVSSYPVSALYDDQSIPTYAMGEIIVESSRYPMNIANYVTHQNVIIGIVDFDPPRN